MTATAPPEAVSDAGQRSVPRWFGPWPFNRSRIAVQLTIGGNCSVLTRPKIHGTAQPYDLDQSSEQSDTEPQARVLIDRHDSSGESCIVFRPMGYPTRRRHAFRNVLISCNDETPEGTTLRVALRI
ncbi:hypothetical protein PsYK624_044720 [Phanerochaete sordida]|uniref:Uncharacterized protein n=1 Tax=Phanerochaete sordida TaxID=48140 RepID=A0A9P3LBB4_9APHY|nr:hypothetical protein PsYK624_044720 [Phanerochaete sordida]